MCVYIYMCMCLYMCIAWGTTAPYHWGAILNKGRSFLLQTKRLRNSSRQVAALQGLTWGCPGWDPKIQKRKEKQRWEAGDCSFMPYLHYEACSSCTANSETRRPADLLTSGLAYSPARFSRLRGCEGRAFPDVRDCGCISERHGPTRHKSR